MLVKQDGKRKKGRPKNDIDRWCGEGFEELGHE
jgi:hypothetical protein